MSDLWDYDESDQLPIREAAPKPDDDDDDTRIEEDEDGNGRPSRKRARIPNRIKQASKVKHAIDTDDDEVEVLNLADDDDDDVGINMKTTASQAMLSNGGDSMGTSPSCGPSKGRALSIPAPKSAPAESFLDDATRKILEESKALAKALRAQLDDEDDSPAKPPPARARSSASSLHRPSNLRMMLSQSSSMSRASADVLAAVRRTGAQGAGAASEDVDLVDEEDAELLRADAAATAAAGRGAAVATAAATGQSSEFDMLIVFQCRKGEAKLRVRKDDPFSKLQVDFIAFAESKGWLPKGSGTVAPQAFKMVWDDERIDLVESPSSLGIEDGERVDVSWKG